jgi:hypothetical protein
MSAMGFNPSPFLNLTQTHKRRGMKLQKLEKLEEDKVLTLIWEDGFQFQVHARCSFSFKGSRWLQRCYSDHDGLLSPPDFLGH